MTAEDSGRRVDVGVLFAASGPGDAITHARRYDDAGVTAAIADDVDGHLGTLVGGVRPRTLDPFALLSALAATTDRIGLVATVATRGNDPFTIARKLASLDHLSRGRAGWNVPPGDDDGRGDEVVDAVTGLWDTVADDAFVRDRASGIYLRRGGRRPLDFRGVHVSTAGPLNISRPPQGHPVIFHVGPAATVPAFAARHAEVFVTAPRDIGEARADRDALGSALARHGRSRSDVRIWPVLPATVADASAVDIAGHIGRWSSAGVADGVVVDPVATRADSLVDAVLPELRRRGLWRGPSGTTLREALALRRPDLTVADQEARA